MYLRRALLASIVTSVAIAVACAGEIGVGAPAPEFGGTRFHNVPQGTKPSLASLRGKVVLIDFWATWCKPCVASIPHLVKLHEQYAAKGLVVIGHTDGSSRGLEKFIAQKKIPYVISEGPDIGGAYGVNGIPHVVLVDVAGKVAWRGHPAELDEHLLKNLLKSVK